MTTGKQIRELQLKVRILTKKFNEWKARNAPLWEEHERLKAQGALLLNGLGPLEQLEIISAHPEIFVHFTEVCLEGEREAETIKPVQDGLTSSMIQVACLEVKGLNRDHKADLIREVWPGLTDEQRARVRAEVPEAFLPPEQAEPTK
jgi:hypothetical protein